MWELDSKESWALKNWCFWTVMLEKTLQSPLCCRSNQSILKEISPEIHWNETQTPILWPPDAKNWLIGKDHDFREDWRQEEKGTTEDEMVGWHHRLDGHEFEQAPGVGDGQGGLECCSPWGCKELDMTEWLNWTGQPGKSLWSESVSYLVTPNSGISWTVAPQAPLSMGFSSKEYWSGLSFPPPGDLPNPGIEPGSAAVKANSLPSEPPGKSLHGF